MNSLTYTNFIFTLILNNKQYVRIINDFIYLIISLNCKKVIRSPLIMLFLSII